MSDFFGHLVKVGLRSDSDSDSDSDYYYYYSGLSSVIFDCLMIADQVSLHCSECAFGS